MAQRDAETIRELDSYVEEEQAREVWEVALRAYIYSCIHIYTYIYIYRYVYECKCMYIYQHIYICIYIYMYVYMDVSIYPVY